MTGVSLTVRSARQTSRPSASGSPMSRTTTSGLSDAGDGDAVPAGLGGGHRMAEGGETDGARREEAGVVVNDENLRQRPASFRRAVTWPA